MLADSREMIQHIWLYCFFFTTILASLFAQHFLLLPCHFKSFYFEAVTRNSLCLSQRLVLTVIIHQKRLHKTRHSRFLIFSTEDEL